MIKLMRTRLGELLIDVWSGVYPPRRSTRLLIKYMEGLTGDKVLDYGCGSGILGLVALSRGASRVVCIDISLRACRNALMNFRTNGMADSVDVVVSDGSACLRDASFNLVVLNPPMTPSPRPLPRYTWGGVDGREFIRRHVQDVDRILKSGGRLLVTASSLVGIDWVISMLERHGFSVEILEQVFVRCGKLMRGLLEYLSSLGHASIFDLDGEPHWRLAVLKAEKPAPK